MGHTMWETFRPTFNKHRLWVVGFFFFPERFWNGSWLFAHWGKRPTLFSEDPSWTRSEKWQVCSGRLIRANERLLCTVLRSEYTTAMRRRHTERWPLQHHNPESMVRQPSVWQLNLGAFFLLLLGSDDSRFSIILYRTDKHRDKRNPQRISKYYSSQQLQAQDISCVTHYEFKN